MEIDAIARGDTVVDVAPLAWGKVILEEVLFRAASACSDGPAPDGCVKITMEFEIRADEAARQLEISTPGAIERAIVTRVPL